MNILKNVVRFLIAPIFILVLILVLSIAGLYLYYTPTLPSKEEIAQIELQIPLRIYDKDKRLIAEYGRKRRIPLALKDIPQRLQDAFIAIEDARFYKHHGVDSKGVVRALYKMVSTGSRREGASTITMQLARNAYLSRERTLERKIREALLAIKIEQTLTKNKILEIYLNKIYLGNRSYGVAAAAYTYYGKSVDQLSLAQSAMIAGLPKAPSRFNPLVNPERAKIRRDYILTRMLKYQKITAEEYETARAEALSARRHRTPIETNAPYMAEMVRSAMVEKFGKDQAYTQGLRVYTTLDAEAQKVADDTLQKHLLSYSRRHGYRGAEAQINLDEFTTQAAKLKKLKEYSVYSGLYPALVLASDKKSAQILIRNGEHFEIKTKHITWARTYISEDRRGQRPTQVSSVLKAGDIIRVKQIPIDKKPKKTANNNLNNEVSDNESIDTKSIEPEPTEPKYTWQFTQIPKVAGALISMDPSNGAVNALSGGFNYYLSKFNRVIQAERQPGSSFKPFIYTAALAKGFTPNSMVNDAPIHIPGSRWRPENYGGRFYGPTSLAKGLAKSRNLVSIRLLRRIGVSYAKDFAERFGLRKQNMPHNLTLALGTGLVTPFEMASAYSAFANGGYRVTGHYISHITNNVGDIISEPEIPVACLACELDPTTISDLSNRERPATRIINTKTHFQAVGLMQGVTHFGTAAKAGRILKRADIAGKTGTTNDQKDAWFCGYMPKKVVVVWMGFDHLAPLGERETATAAALPVWIDFMKNRLADLEDKPWVQPERLIRVKLDAITGKVATDDSDDIVEEEIETEQKSRIVAADKEDKTGFEVFNNIPPEVLVPKRQSRRKSKRNNNDRNSRSNNSNTSASTPKRSAPTTPERVEIPEQLF
jgi:penicillin-binding protein 1A